MKNFTTHESIILKDHIFHAHQQSNIYHFDTETWFKELSRNEITFFNYCIELLQTSPEDILQLFVNRKKRKALLKKVELTKAKKSKDPKIVEAVEQFLSAIPFEQLCAELIAIPLLFDYTIEQHVGVYCIGLKEDEQYQAFPKEQLQSGYLVVEKDENTYHLSIQSLLYFILACELVHEVDEVRIATCKCQVTDVTYAVSYGHALLEPLLNHFFIQPADNCVTSTLLAHIMFTKTIRFLQDALEQSDLQQSDYLEDVQQQLLAIEKKYIAVTNTAYIHYLQKVQQQLVKKENVQQQKLVELDKKYDKLKEKFDVETEAKKQLKQELQKLQQNEKQQSTIDVSQLEVLDEMKQQNKELKDVKKELEREIRQQNKDFDNKLSELISENERLKTENSSIQQQLIQEKRAKLQNDELSFEEWLSKGNQYLAALTSVQEQQLQNFIDIAAEFIQEQRNSRQKQSLTTNKVGYCVFTDGQLAIQLAGGDVVVAENIPEDVYMSELQFVELTADNEFVQLLADFYYDGAASKDIAHFAIAVERNGQPYVKINGKLEHVIYKENVQIREGQVISVNSRFELVYYYQPRAITLDDLYPSILIKGHEPYYVELALQNGYVLRNLKGEQCFKSLDATLPSRSFVVLQQDDQITLRDDSGLIFKKSTLYKEKQLASVSAMEDDIYVLKPNEEYVVLHDVLSTQLLELGDMVWVDEHNSYIYTEEIPLETIVQETIEQKLKNTTRFKVTSKQPAKPAVEKIESLLIIGNIRLSERYKKYFGELGYIVEVVDGAGPYEKIRQACTKHELIIYCTAFTKHQHSYKMQVDIQKPYILCDSTSPQVMKNALEKNLQTL